MALTVNAAVDKAALDGITPLFNSGHVRLLEGATEVAQVVFGSTAFGAGTSASPSVATANAMTADTSIDDDRTINAFDMRTSGAASRISGSVGTSGADWNVSDNVIPAGTTEITISSFQLSLNVT